MTPYERAIEAIAKQMCLMECCDVDPCESGQCYDENKSKANAILSLKGKGWRLAIVQDVTILPQLEARIIERFAGGGGMYNIPNLNALIDAGLVKEIKP